ncbi:hypothetical protein [Streptomyces sp. NPDC026673]|uniref:hypothetical protein n=1 Tax=Streptomyces sp. NPDC026673 TaxID=3155724 RepID=UPI0033FF672E
MAGNRTRGAAQQLAGAWSPRERVRSRTNWVSVAAAAPLLLLFSFAATYVQFIGLLWYAVGPLQEDCAHIERHSGGTVPAGATDVVCTSSGNLNDQDHEIDFRMPRQGAEERLLDAFPRLRRESRCAVDACFRVRPDEPVSRRRWGYLEATVVYEDDRTAHVHVFAT